MKLTEDKTTFSHDLWKEEREAFLATERLAMKRLRQAQEAFQRNPASTNKQALDAAYDQFLRTPSGIQKLRAEGHQELADTYERERRLFLLTVSAEPADRLTAAQDPSSKRECLAMLARDHNPFIRSAVREHPNTPKKVRDSIQLRSTRKHNGYKTTPAMMRKHALDKAYLSQLAAIVQHPDNTAEALADFVSHPEPAIRRTVMSHRNASAELLALGATDPVEKVKQVAVMRLSDPPVAGTGKTRTCPFADSSN